VNGERRSESKRIKIKDFAKNEFCSFIPFYILSLLANSGTGSLRRGEPRYGLMGNPGIEKNIYYHDDRTTQ